MLAAIEIYNKPTVEYREQTLTAAYLTNAWEVLLKARLIQLAGGKLETIYARDKTGELRETSTHVNRFRLG